MSHIRFLDLRTSRLAAQLVNRRTMQRTMSHHVAHHGQQQSWLGTLVKKTQMVQHSDATQLHASPGGAEERAMCVSDVCGMLCLCLDSACLFFLSVCLSLYIYISISLVSLFALSLSIALPFSHSLALSCSPFLSLSLLSLSLTLALSLSLSLQHSKCIQSSAGAQRASRFRKPAHKQWCQVLDKSWGPMGAGDLCSFRLVPGDLR